MAGSDPLRVVVLEDDETGQELLEQALRVLAPGVTGILGHRDCEQASRAVYEAVLEAVANGVSTPDLGGHASTTEFTDAVIERVQTKREVWSSL